MQDARRQLPDMGAARLVDRVARLPQLARIASAIDAGRDVRIAGLRGSSGLFALEALRRAVPRPAVICCADDESARDAVSDLTTLSAARVEFFPERDIFPQPFEFKENLLVRGKRNACLDKVHRGEVDIVVTSLSGFLERTLTVDALTNRVHTLTVGQTLDREELLEYLVSVGYEATPVIEELGQFAVRGSIIDIFDPSSDNPVRLELIDDELASMRAFDIDSQTSVNSLEEIRLLPATGVVVNPSSLAQLKNRLVDADFDPDKIREIVDEIEGHRFSFLLRRYAPAMGLEGSLLDFYDEPPLLFFLDTPSDPLESLKTEFEKVQKMSDEYPLLPFDDYILPLDFYTRHETSTVHVWSSAAALERAQAEKSSSDLAVTFQTSEHPSVMGKIEPLIRQIRGLRAKGCDVLIFSDGHAQRERLADMLEEDEELVHLPVGWLTSGFVWQDAGLAVFTDHEIFHRALPRPADRRKVARMRRYRADDLSVGDFVVHVDYGIGRYVGLEKIATDGGETECLSLRYHGGDRIFVPVDQMPLVEKYIGKEGVVPSLDRLGSAKWQRTKTRTRKALEQIAKDMLRVHAEREMATRQPFGPDTPWQKELEAAFPFEETPHQLQSTDDIKRDMQSPKPMDRLVCGDVGFGKTEVAIRAAFKAVNEGRQVAVLVPTTILALQHYKTFSERMAPFPVRIETLSRFKTAAEQKVTVADVKKGSVDIVIGTHRLLSKDIAFHDIGLLIVDEEHRFGVRSKEKIKRIKRSVDVLSMTATPIPRTLYLALSGLRPISIIDTPPRNRHPVRTEVTTFDEDTIARAITTELARNGQVFFLHNRVASIYSIQAFLEKLLPNVRFGVAHGQMAERDLERVIVSFYNGEFDVLISTTIIESGLDLPNVNTIIINRADRFGLADLYQLRGRVGRRERQAFAYLLVPRNFSITEKASRRLQAMEEFVELGAGYRLAMRDLEIRGAGNILGVEQHGQLVAVGFDLYCKMLKEAVDELQGKEKIEPPVCRIETRLPSLIPQNYVEDQNERMALYKRLARMETPEEVDQIAAELVDRFGRLPRETANLMELTRLKLLAIAVGVRLIQFKTGQIVVEFGPGRALRPEVCAILVETFAGRVLFKSGGSFGLIVTHSGGPDWLDEAKRLLTVAWMHGRKDDSGVQRYPA